MVALLAAGKRPVPVSNQFSLAPAPSYPQENKSSRLVRFDLLKKQMADEIELPILGSRLVFGQKDFVLTDNGECVDLVQRLVIATYRTGYKYDIPLAPHPSGRIWIGGPRAIRAQLVPFNVDFDIADALVLAPGSQIGISSDNNRITSGIKVAIQRAGHSVWLQQRR